MVPKDIRWDMPHAAKNLNISLWKLRTSGSSNVVNVSLPSNKL